MRPESGFENLRRYPNFHSTQRENVCEMFQSREWVMGFILSDVITNFERVSDHCSNVALCLLEVNADEFDTHAYLDTLKKEDNVDFKGKVMTYRERYRLP